ncbi:hypothetical protein GCM10012285_34270 [Streptomyces kronopolitis]|uniref:SH3 domain-containing protein n=1 Tax=Streptomyces kronopolitis TaxID=1612435 RepID=A0ABQ2JI04_9ACTN|nr:hypothetical protein [Streptomyces kronopolitis]GGN47908.1 hypothetical protein GCM10012285_34270 [Streptomyces kronopolitis]
MFPKPKTGLFPRPKTGVAGAFALCVLSGALTGAVVAGPARAADGDGSLAPYEAHIVAKAGVVLRTGPSYEFSAVGSKGYGAVVGIACRLNGQKVEGNRVWYKLSDSSYVWSSERHIVRVGTEPPRWC